MAIYPPIIVARFWSKVAVGKNNECWEWLGAKRHYGYGGLKVKGRVLRSNRIAWEIFNGKPLGDYQALHKCDNPACCNPRHIYAGTKSENMCDIFRRGRKASVKLSRDKANEIRSLRKEGASIMALSKDFGVASSTISKICRNMIWA